jgi:hypothetical protein
MGRESFEEGSIPLDCILGGTMIIRFGQELELIHHAHLRLIHLEAARLELLHHGFQLLPAKSLHILIHLRQPSQEALPGVPAKLHRFLREQRLRLFGLYPEGRGFELDTVHGDTDGRFVRLFPVRFGLIKIILGE